MSRNDKQKKYCFMKGALENISCQLTAHTDSSIRKKALLASEELRQKEHFVCDLKYNNKRMSFVRCLPVPIVMGGVDR